MNSICALLHDVSPYDGFDVDAYPADLQGWGSTDPIFHELIATAKPRLIVEVGSWKGASAIHMANIVRDLGLDTKIICVDTWLGSPEHFLARGAGWRESLLLKHGFPHLYFTFISNVIREGHQDRIIPLPTTSENAAVILREKGIRPDIVYIDAAHEEDAAYRDFRHFWAIMSDDGTLLGDDYIGWPGVTAAANRFAHDVELPIYGKPGKFVISRNPRLTPQITFDLAQA